MRAPLPSMLRKPRKERWCERSVCVGFFLLRESEHDDDTQEMSGGVGQERSHSV